VFLRSPEAIPRTIAAELSAARAVAASQTILRVAPTPHVTLRRATRILPDLTILDTQLQSGQAGRYELHLGEVAAAAPITLLLELMAPPQPAGISPLGRLDVSAEGAPSTATELRAEYGGQVPPTPPAVVDAAARANAARLQQRAIETAARGDRPEAARLLRAAAARLDALDERRLAEIARGQALALEHGIGRERQRPVRVDHTETVRADQPHTTLARRRNERSLSCPASLAAFCEAAREDRRRRDARPAAILYRLDNRIRPQHDIGVVRRLGAIRERGVARLAEELLVAWIDRIDRTREAVLAQIPLRA
jgi:hypothetical protein